MRSSTKRLRMASLASTVLAVALALLTPAVVAFASIGDRWASVWLDALYSALLAAITGSLSAVIGATMALILWEGTSRRMKRAVETVVFTVAGIPAVVIALTVLLLFPRAASLTQVAAAMTLSLTPYAARYVLDDLNDMSPYTIDAMRALGSSGLRTIVSGILPYAKHSILSTLLYNCARALTEAAILMLLLGLGDSYLALRIVAAPLSDTTFPAALVLCVLAMLLFDRARMLHRRR